MNKSRLLGAVCTIAIVFSSHTIAVSFMPLGTLPTSGTFYSTATDVSFDGTVVVGRTSSGSSREAYRWTIEDGMVGLGDFSGGSYASEARAVSADGTTVVGKGRTSTGDAAFRWTNTTGMLGIGTSYPSTAEGVSANGSVVVGTHSPGGGSQAYHLVIGGSGITNLGGLPGGSGNSQAFDVSTDGAVVVGQSSSGSGSEAFQWTSSGGMAGLGDLTGGSFFSIATDVSADGSVIIGRSESAPSIDEAFRWTSGGGMVGLGDLTGGGFFSTANGVSGDGAVIVGQSESAFGREAFIWTSADGMRSVASLLTTAGIDLIGWTLTEAMAISGDGNTIVGYGVNPDGNTEAWLANIAAINLIAVPIDIKPDDSNNSINLSAAGVIPVAILSTADFDATTVDPESVSLAGASVKMVGKSEKYLCNQSDVNEDELIDLVCKIYTAQFMIEKGETNAVMEAETIDGTKLRGEDIIRIVPDR